MSRRISVRAVTRTPDGGGGYTTANTDVGPVWAHVEPLEGDEQIQAMQTGLQRPHRFTIRYQAGLTGASAIVYGSRVFDIKSVVDPDEKHRELVVLADEVTPNA